MAAGPADLDRSAADQCAGRCDQLLHHRSRPSAACVRRGEADGRCADAAARTRRDVPRAERQGLHRHAGGLRDRRCGRRAVAGRRDRRRGDRLRRNHHLGVHRVRAVRSGPRRADRSPSSDRVRCTTAFRTRHRSGADARCGGSGDGDGAGTLRRRAWRGDGSRQVSCVAAHRIAALRADSRPWRLRHSAERSCRLAGTPGLRGAEPRRVAGHCRGAVLAQRHRRRDRAGTGGDAGSRGRGEGGRGMRGDRTGMRPGGGSAAPARS